MAEKTFTEIMSNPARDYCLGRFLSLGLELAKAGYRHSDIASAGLRTGLHHSMEEGMYNHAHFLRGLEEMGRDSLRDIERLYDEAEKAGTLPNG